MTSWTKHSVIPFLFSILIVINFQLAEAKTRANFKPQTSKATVKEVRELLKANNIKTNPIPAAEMKKVFKARTLAHRARLSEIHEELVKNPRFLKEFPEFTMLHMQSLDTVKANLTHDISKDAKKLEPAIDILSELQGYDYRNPPAGVPKDVHEKISAILKNAVGDINGGDDYAMNKVYDRLGRGEKWNKLHKDYIEVLDFYDTWKSRQAEIGGNGRKLSSPSEWIEKMENDGMYDDDEKVRNKLKKRFSKFLETHDPLKNPARFTSTEEMLPDPKNTTDRQLNKKFKEKQKKFIAMAKGHVVRTKPHLAKGIAMGGAAAAGSLAYNYIQDPESITLESAITAPVGEIKELGKCSTKTCYDFISSCRRLLNLKTSVQDPEVLGHPNVSMCYAAFFEKPLNEQSELRADAGLNELLEQWAPRVTDLQCEGDKRVLVETKTNKRFDRATFDFDDKGVLSKISRINESTTDQILPGSNLVKHCKNPSDCKSWELSKVAISKTYIWNNIDYPVDTYKWAQAQEKVRNVVEEKLLECCGDKKCEGHFTAKRNFDRTHRSIVQSAR